jgi:hypothetical protein
MDLATHTPEWTMVYDTRSGTGEVRGKTPVGGVSLGLFIAAGLEVGNGVR